MSTTTHDLLVELGTEELPPKALKTLMEAFAAGLTEGLEEAGLAHEAVAAFASPRRLAVKITRLASAQPDREVEHRGPPAKIAFDDDGQPTRAALGFAQTHGVKVDQLERVQTAKGEWLYFRGTERGAPSAELLPELVQAALDKLPIPRRMRWGSSNEEFVRPVHWLVLLLDDEVLPATLFGIPAGRTTRGHRVHAPAPIELASVSDYPDKLHDSGYVVADFAARRAQIETMLGEAAVAASAMPVSDDSLLDEVTALVEWPQPISGSIPEEYLALPEEVLIATLQEHQRYFPLRGSSGELLPAFVAIANLESTRPEQVREGNERVVRPRLADAAFFYGEDRKRPLADRLAQLDQVLFQEQLGSLGDKARRVEVLARSVANGCGADTDVTARAALLARCDLVTDMVGEFPGLQGTMGRYYALADGEPAEVALAIEELYLPRHAGDVLPASAPGRALAIADRLDTLAGIFAIGQPPSGTRDPFGLRRAALGVLRISIENELPLDLHALLKQALSQLPLDKPSADVAEQVFDYMLERLRAYYLDGAAGAGVTPEMFEAVLARRPSRPLDFHHRVLAVREFMDHEAAGALAAANKRIANILKKAEDDWPAECAPALLEEPAEKALHAELQAVAPAIEEHLRAANYAAAFARLAALRPEVDRFFDDVMVMSDDARLRGNRLALLASLHALFTGAADISRLSTG